ncbi:alternative oxidase [Naegleria gruberi]|uniref:Alternative oxidase n=1 Tax=Naegleria gruberi TaxID=5762 RepID=D2V4B2_NAEGR|nr:alternative oxidase [Naegleria gruberi]EFC48485.1 alternative oxidase [Naegleria gruberi]|eukprot:XP_002681229.1 alternative oxidase [Naegleria gruberi strain NEG-M]
MVYKHYETNHTPLAQAKFRPYGDNAHTNTQELEKYQVLRSYSPVDLTDKLALGIMKFLRVFVHGFFGNRYLHHAVVLETVAAVPGIVAGGWRHFNSLRLMRRDHGHIGELMEEAENERMHLLTWMEMTKPTFLERMLVVGAQVGFTSFYTMAYLLNPRFCHRLVGYLEEEAVAAYSEFLEAIDKGDIPNCKAPEIAIKYWNLKPESTMRDVVVVVRADECMHRDYNHDMSDKHRSGLIELR